MELIDRSLGCDNDDDDNNIKQSSMIWEKNIKSSQKNKKTVPVCVCDQFD
jgi:hypothetical protein